MYTLNDFRVGNRVQLHPATDLWMQGGRYGTVIKVGQSKLLVNVEQAGRAVRCVVVTPNNIYEIMENVR